ncbi:hypothetical protein AB1Y20_021731 [Prymnesium parvum]|uniref:Uncharacterized protein n=1 Tax=Prymnesium parvum TaxID=97485 RepID=A0AB34JM19_PRYPA
MQKRGFAALLTLTPTLMLHIPCAALLPHPTLPLNSSLAYRLNASAHLRANVRRSLILKDQGISRLRNRVQERALLMTHSLISDGTGHYAKIAVVEAENERLRGELAHRTSQLHSAVARIAALKERIDDLLRQVDDLSAAKEEAEIRVVKEKQRKARTEPMDQAEREAWSSLIGTQDTMLTAIETLSAVPRPTTDESITWLEAQRKGDLGESLSYAQNKSAARAAKGATDAYAKLRQYERRFGAHVD